MGDFGNGSKRALHFHRAPRRVVSLVPSITESLWDLGLGESLVGITDYCIYPAEQLQELPRLGGPKNPRVDEILALNPDLILANQEENTPATVHALEAAGLPVLVTFPTTVRQALDVLWLITGIYQSQTAAVRLETIEFTLEWMKSASFDQSKKRYFCPIWQDTTGSGEPWWMTFNQHTYIHDLLSLLGGENVFSDRDRHYPLAADLGEGSVEEPGERDTRYPRVVLDEILRGDPEIILLPSEPFVFDEQHKQAIEDLMGETTAVKDGRVYLVDGSLLTWHGTRLGKAFQELPDLFS
jgi:ABC-type Fe3+-hydroxamate transport system substrate-binding protein